MAEVFADTGYWIALLNPNDELHESAIAATRLASGRRIVTTEMVLVEFLNFVGGEGRHGRQVASMMVKDLQGSPDVEVLAQSSTQFQAAVDLYASRLDQSWSVVDCASFLLMQQRGIRDALAFDRNFKQAGFTALLR